MTDRSVNKKLQCPRQKMRRALVADVLEIQRLGVVTIGTPERLDLQDFEIGCSGDGGVDHGMRGRKRRRGKRREGKSE